MGHYIRVLGTQDPAISLDELRDVLTKAGMQAKLIEVDESANNWAVIDVENEGGQELARIERDPVVEGLLGEQELAEFKELIREEQPQSAVRWLTAYFDTVKVIYAFQLLNAAFEDNNYDIISAIRGAIWDKTGGILQADGEGFSNEGGYHILWQFSDTVDGDGYCAVLNERGEWEKFRMDLGDPFQRMAFRAGEVPQGAVKLTK